MTGWEMSIIFGGRSAAIRLLKKKQELSLFIKRKMIGIHEEEAELSQEMGRIPSLCSSSVGNRLVIIEGNIGTNQQLLFVYLFVYLFVCLFLQGVGKTTLAKKLSRSLDYKLFIEPTIENPYLERFYAQPKKYAISLQLWILRQRYNTYLEAVRHVLATGLQFACCTC